MSSSDDQAGKRVDFDLLEFDDDLALLSGVPFTGIAVSHYPDATLECECRYHDGLPQGLNQLWYPNGTLLRRWIAIRGAGSSESWTWYPDGSARSYRQEVGPGLPPALKAWNEAGEEIDPVSQPPVNRADVMAALFEWAMDLKEAAH